VGGPLGGSPAAGAGLGRCGPAPGPGSCHPRTAPARPGLPAGGAQTVTATWSPWAATPPAAGRPRCCWPLRRRPARSGSARLELRRRAQRSRVARSSSVTTSAGSSGPCRRRANARSGSTTRTDQTSNKLAPQDTSGAGFGHTADTDRTAERQCVGRPTADAGFRTGPLLSSISVGLVRSTRRRGGLSLAD
jgi:hypothetical protein